MNTSNFLVKNVQIILTKKATLQLIQLFRKSYLSTKVTERIKLGPLERSTKLKNLEFLRKFSAINFIDLNYLKPIHNSSTTMQW